MTPCEREDTPNLQQRWRQLVGQANSMNITPHAMLKRVGKSNPGELTHSNLNAIAAWLNEQTGA